MGAGVGRPHGRNVRDMPSLGSLHDNGQVMDSWWIDKAIVAMINHFNGGNIDRRRFNFTISKGSFVELIPIIE